MPGSTASRLPAGTTTEEPRGIQLAGQDEPTPFGLAEPTTPSPFQGRGPRNRGMCRRHHARAVSVPTATESATIFRSTQSDGSVRLGAGRNHRGFPHAQRLRRIRLVRRTSRGGRRRQEGCNQNGRVVNLAHHDTCGDWVPEPS
jgi:hypothetical protein